MVVVVVFVVILLMGQMGRMELVCRTEGIGRGLHLNGHGGKLCEDVLLLLVRAFEYLCHNQ
jgi:hypothetical protein